MATDPMPGGLLSQSPVSSLYRSQYLSLSIINRCGTDGSPRPPPDATGSNSHPRGRPPHLVPVGLGRCFPPLDTGRVSLTSDSASHERLSDFSPPCTGI